MEGRGVTQRFKVLLKGSSSKGYDGVMYVCVSYSPSENEAVEETWEDEGQQSAAAGAHQSHEGGELGDGQHYQSCQHHQCGPQHTLEGRREGGRGGREGRTERREGRREEEGREWEGREGERKERG